MTGLPGPDPAPVAPAASAPAASDPAAPAVPHPAGRYGGPDPAEAYDARLVLGEEGPQNLRVFNSAGVLAPADVHLARRLCRLAGEDDELVALAAALAGRAPRVGHVSVDLATVRSSAVVAGDDEAAVDSLPWPDPAGWVPRVAGSALVDAGPEPAGGAAGAAGGEPVSRPLRLEGTHLYLDRYWRDEMDVAADLLRRAEPARRPGPAGGGRDPDGVDPGPGGAGAPSAPRRLEELFPGDPARDQRQAAAVALSGRLSVIVGGPGTGKTTTVARLLALITETAIGAGRRAPLIGLAAPTGKAAARMEEAVRSEAARMAVADATRAHLGSVAGVTIHRLLGSRPDRVSRFRHHRGHRLPHDVVVVDEASMVSLALMARLLEAVRPDARLILVGDPEQLVSVEAGAVLADIVGPTARPAGADGGRLAGRIAVLRTNHRFSGPLAELASAVRAGRTERALEVLAGGHPAVRWLPSPPAGWDRPAGSDPGDDPGGEVLRELLTGWAADLVAEARAGRGRSALDVLARHRLLCAHRDGPAGVTVWNRRIEEWVAAVQPAIGLEGPWYAGRPVMVTANDYGMRLFNGDTGVVVAVPGPDGTGPEPASPTTGSRVVAVDGAGGRVRTVSPFRLQAVDTVFATTVHKSQGSEYDRVTVVLPPETSRLLTRELLYTAVTRARQGVLVVGSEAAVRRAVGQPLSRASGLGRRLWDRPAPIG
ncbi:MAG TPA: exodeoxyribonuclease V subunit alpha [Acidimicrobiales bacterium]|nr:exodeoxyribonuclease V subunit alpha [Acidimicrobiales bacterium]